MLSFLTLIGSVACAVAISFAIIKAIEAVWFFQEFRKRVDESLKRIEETLRTPKS